MFCSFWSRSVAPINSSNVSLPTPSLDLPDVADLFAPPADNASRKRESNGSALHDSRSKIPRMQSQPRGIRNAAGNTLIPPQLRGRLVFFFFSSCLFRCHVGSPYYMYSLTPSTNQSNAVCGLTPRMYLPIVHIMYFVSLSNVYLWLLLHRSNVVTEDMSKLFVAKRKE